MNLQELFNTISVWILPVILIVIFTFAIIKKVPVYENFIEGAKDGFDVAIKIIPYLIAIMVGISLLRASGFIEFLGNTFSCVFTQLSIPTDVFPLFIVRSLSGSAALGVFSDIANNFGPDSYATKLAAIVVGSSETTFYVLTVYFGSVGIKKFRYALLAGLFADFIGIMAAILVAHHFFL
ncbi:spore maturation protein [bacterium]|nr:spore maturation protein [bacterium]